MSIRFICITNSQHFLQRILHLKQITSNVFSLQIPLKKGVSFCQFSFQITNLESYFTVMSNLPTKTCLACNKILKGRTDKKFCDDYCRNHYNNQHKPDKSNFVRTVINSLRKNKKILENFLGEEEMVKTTKERLLNQGFQFKYHTHTYENKKGAVYTFCFELGYLPLDNDWFLVVRREE